MRLVKVLAVAVVGLALPWLVAAAGEAGEVRISTPGIERVDRDDGRGRWQGRHDHRHHQYYRPGVVLLAPSRCWQPGYWVQQWVPQAYTYPTWVAGHWSRDGRWIEGHYVPYVHHAGYYQPYWLEGSWVSC